MHILNSIAKGVDLIIKINLLPPTTQRVFLRTDPNVNASIRNQTIKKLNLYKNSNDSDITERIRELSMEWDTERMLESNAALLVFLGSYLGLKTNRCWFLLTGAVGLFLLLHATHGWCPPLTLIRKLGIRTPDEINQEKMALKAMRGDFETKENSSAVDLLNMVEKQ